MLAEVYELSAFYRNLRSATQFINYNFKPNDLFPLRSRFCPEKEFTIENQLSQQLCNRPPQLVRLSPAEP